MVSVFSLGMIQNILKIYTENDNGMNEFDARLWSNMQRRFNLETKQSQLIKLPGLFRKTLVSEKDDTRRENSSFHLSNEVELGKK